MNKSQRIHLDVESLSQDKNIKIKLEQDIDSIEFLTMSIDAKDVYRDFNADYGVLVGRVIANGGIGISNAKISVFIPLSDDDADDSSIASIYPYKTPRDKNAEGKRYNLLPRVAQINPANGTFSPKQPFGSFPIKPEIVINQPFLNVYKKYYKYTALTNSAGDYMIFGVPIGTQIVHLSVDITDIGKYSMSPAAMVTNLGYSPNLFTDNNTKIKPSTDLNDLPNIETQEITVDVIPFWGDTTNFVIGITRQDFRIRSVLSNTFVIFGSAFTDGDNSMWGENFDDGGRTIRELYRARNDANLNISIQSKRIGTVSEKIYYYPATITDAEIDAGTVNPETQMILLDKSEYSVYKRDGDFVFIINCNRNRVITDEFGNEVPTDENSTNGVFTKFRGFITLEITEDAVPMTFSGSIGNNTNVIPIRYALKFPQHSLRNHSFTETENTDTQNWRKQNYTFNAGNLYSLSRFHGVVHNQTNNEDDNDVIVNGFSQEDRINFPFNADPFWDTGIIQTNDNAAITGNDDFDMVSNTSDGTTELFGANWLNLSVHLPQVGFLQNGTAFVKNWKSTTNFSQQFKSVFYYTNNTQPIAGGQFNTKWFARSDLHWTDFIVVPKEDVLAMNSVATKGFTDEETPSTLNGTYRNGVYTPPTDNWGTPCPINGGKLNGNTASGADPKTYFYKGLKDANCIEFLISLGLV